ncbi:hypothetical protein IWX90DRAFT_129296 [Phyllosticta citrichinensis]|uniref:Uncharacterized protein n=1 Tax=Phyllosticta citrichinensis TaxID=1130410 RepID=A0ABR1Y4P8_9PEZI
MMKLEKTQHAAAVDRPRRVSSQFEHYISVTSAIVDIFWPGPQSASHSVFRNDPYPSPCRPSHLVRREQRGKDTTFKTRHKRRLRNSKASGRQRVSTQICLGIRAYHGGARWPTTRAPQTVAYPPALGCVPLPSSSPAQFVVTSTFSLRFTPQNSPQVPRDRSTTYRDNSTYERTIEGRPTDGQNFRRQRPTPCVLPSLRCPCPPRASQPASKQVLASIPPCPSKARNASSPSFHRPPRLAARPVPRHPHASATAHLRSTRPYFPPSRADLRAATAAAAAAAQSM